MMIKHKTLIIVVFYSLILIFLFFILILKFGEKKSLNDMPEINIAASNVNMTKEIPKNEYKRNIHFVLNGSLNYKPLLSSFKLGDKITSLPIESSNFCLDIAMLLNFHEISIYTSDGYEYSYPVNKLLNYKNSICKLYCPQNIPIKYSFKNLSSPIDISLETKWESDRLPSDCIPPNSLSSEYVFNATSANHSVIIINRLGIIHSTAKSSQGIFYPDVRTDSINSNENEIIFEHNQGASLTFKCTFMNREDTPESHVFAIRHLPRNKTFISQYDKNKDVYYFSNLLFGEYEIVTPKNVLIIPSEKADLFTFSEGKISFYINQYTNNITVIHTRLTPTKFALENHLGPTAISASLNYNIANKMLGINIKWTNFFKILNFYIYFESENLNISNIYYLLPGDYEFSFAPYNQDKSPILDPYFPTIKHTIPKQNDIYTVYLKYSETGNVLGKINSDFFNKYTAFLYKKEDVNSFYKEAVQSAFVDNDNFFLKHIPIGEYFVIVKDIKSDLSVQSDYFDVIASATKTIYLNSSNNETEIFNGIILDAQKVPIRNSKILLIKNCINTYSKTDQNGRFAIKYMKDDYDKGTLRLFLNNGFMLTHGFDQIVNVIDDNGKEFIYTQLTHLNYKIIDQDNIPLKNYNLLFSSENGNYKAQSFSISDENGFGALEAFPIGTVTIKGTQNGSEKEFKYMTNIVLQNDRLMSLTINQPHEIKVRFCEKFETPISDVILFEYQNKNNMIYYIPSSHWPEMLLSKEVKRSNSEGIITISLGLNEKEKVFLYYHNNYGVGFFTLDYDSADLIDILLQKPISINFKSLQFVPKQNNMYFMFLKPDIQDHFPPIIIQCKKDPMPIIKLQPKNWLYSLVATDSDISEIKQKLDNLIYIEVDKSVSIEPKITKIVRDK